MAENPNRASFLPVIAVIVLAVLGSDVCGLPPSEIVIDNFTDGDLSVTLDTTNTWIDEVQTGLDQSAVIGGRREILAWLNEAGDPSKQTTITLDASLGTFRVNSEHELEGYQLHWGLRHLSDGPPELALNADLLEGNEVGWFEILIESLSQETLVCLEVRSGVNEDAVGWNSPCGILPASATPYYLYVRTPFFPDVDFTDVDYIGFGSAGVVSPGLDITLGEIVWIPHSATRRGDVNGDNRVGGDDLTIILTNWGLSG